MPGTYISPAESGFYYLTSRYYDLHIGRFINADGYASTGQGILGNNMYAYCGNNPVNYTDFIGYLPCKSIVGNQAMVYGGSCRPVVDLTEKLDELMEQNVEEIRAYKEENGYVAAAVYFYENVTDGGKMYIKLQDDWKFEEGKTYVYNGMELREDDPGNINYGDLSTYYDDSRNDKVRIFYLLGGELMGNKVSYSFLSGIVSGFLLYWILVVPTSTLYPCPYLSVEMTFSCSTIIGILVASAGICVKNRSFVHALLRWLIMLVSYIAAILLNAYIGTLIFLETLFYGGELSEIAGNISAIFMTFSTVVVFAVSVIVFVIREGIFGISRIIKGGVRRKV